MKPFNFLNIAQDNESIDIYLNGEIIDSDLQWLYDYFEIEGTSPKSFKAMLDAAGGKPLTLHINSIGGDLIAGMAMYSAIKNYKGETTAIIDSICASAATLPMVACKKVIMQVPSTMMIHCASMWTGGNKQELEKDIETLKSLDNSIANAYEEKTKFDRKELLKMMEAETWLDSKKAKELGFIDEINGQTEVPQAVIQNIIDNNKRLVACYRGFEHPKEGEPAEADNSADSGSKLYNGKFKSVEDLEKAYANLQSDYTRKSTLLAELQKEAPKTEQQQAAVEPQDDSAKIKAELEFVVATARARNILKGA